MHLFWEVTGHKLALQQFLPVVKAAVLLLWGWGEPGEAKSGGKCFLHFRRIHLCAVMHVLAIDIGTTAVKVRRAMTGFRVQFGRV